MSHLVIASSEADAAAAAAVEQHHAELAGALAVATQRLLTAAAHGDAEAAEAARGELVSWCRTELVPHAAAEEEALYPAARGREAGRLLVDGMLAEHTVIRDLLEDIAAAKDPVRAAAAGAALRAVFDSHLAKENELVLPLLVGAPDVSVAELLAGMHEVLGEQAHPDSPDVADSEHAHGHGGHSCGCGEVDGAGYPELDARVVPHAIRHATIFGALDAVRPGGGLVLVAPHDPLPMLAQLERRSPGTFAVDYLERGPEAWRLQIVRRTA
jgi:uncharacterized protein (DUF2249 family)/iron-sulfur cluster repair protein YtfE (RIC family)